MPGIAFRENTSLVAGAVASPLTAPLLAWIFYPFYVRLRVTTFYGYIGHRYGMAARHCISALFTLARLGWLGVVIYAPSLAISVVTGINIYVAVLPLD